MLDMTNLTFLDLFQKYGWQLSLVALLGCFIVGWIKTPIKKAMTKSTVFEDAITVPKNGEKNFDIVGFILGFVVASILGSLYTVVALKLHWMAPDSTRISDVYVSNALGTWSFQILIYQIWSKFGVKRLCAVIFKAFVGLFDKNKDGSVSAEEAAAVIGTVVKDGKLDLDEVLATVAKVVPSVVGDIVETITEEAGEDGKVDIKQNISTLADAAQSIVENIPQEKLSSVASALTEKAEEKLKEVADNPVPVPETAKVAPVAKKKPKGIKF